MVQMIFDTLQIYFRHIFQTIAFQTIWPARLNALKENLKDEMCKQTLIWGKLFLLWGETIVLAKWNVLKKVIKPTKMVLNESTQKFEFEQCVSAFDNIK